MDPARIASVPADLRNRLADALLEGEVADIEAHIDAIRCHDVALADALGVMAKQFKYIEILALLDARDSDSSRSIL